uniref:Uncharacterized protein n=1 Tax=Arundo donax TaxID=35708 RepID=A0A0A9DGX4_ARUDO
MISKTQCSEVYCTNMKATSQPHKSIQECTEKAIKSVSILPTSKINQFSELNCISTKRQEDYKNHSSSQYIQNVQQ